ncbi:sugar phosphate isomerase/epimerase [uncultured Alsobacter sp.]|uniref:sugar phosphate isomerase/epimerase family protein n=1 Tax=uncultured Alsobacter sp. TaxID=1748258 RepID=UPI0025EB1654|nr:sugar phosphate isomerase/epimerase [uncultured Alsobacter sp.]
MQIVMFTKLFKGLTLDEVATHLNQVGFPGVDLLIRDGHQVTPAQPEGIAPAVALLMRAGLAVPMATTDVVEATPQAERVFAACREAGIGTIRLGYYKYAGQGYREIFDDARRKLDGLDALAGRTGVQLAIQLHGDTIHASGAQTLRLLEDHDPARISAYPDPGNQVVQDGRDDWRFTFDVLKPWLSCVGVKNGGWYPGTINPMGQRQWHSDWTGIPDGMVPWDAVIRHLRETGFGGYLTLHSHYEMPLGQALDQTLLDLRYVKRQLES